MGRYSDSENSDSYSKSKKRKKRSRSRSVSVESSTSNYDRKYGKKKKKTKRKYRSRSRERRRSRSRSPRRRSPRRRSVSRSPRRRSYSRSPQRRSRSPRRRSLSPSPKPSSRKIKRERSRSRSPSSRSYRKYSRDRSRSKSPVKIKEESREESACSQIPGYDRMDPIAQAEVRMQMALKAAALADQKLKKQGVLGSSPKLEDVNITDQLERAKLIDSIETDGFNQTEFRSTKSQKEDSVVTLPSHEEAIFGSGSNVPEFAPSKPKLMYQESDTLLHPIHYESDAMKFERWKFRLKDLRRRRLEGEAIVY